MGVHNAIVALLLRVSYMENRPLLKRTHDTRTHVHGCKMDALKGFIQAWNGCQLHHVPSKECNTWKGFI